MDGRLLIFSLRQIVVCRESQLTMRAQVVWNRYAIGYRSVSFPGTEILLLDEHKYRTRRMIRTRKCRGVSDRTVPPHKTGLVPANSYKFTTFYHSSNHSIIVTKRDIISAPTSGAQKQTTIFRYQGSIPGGERRNEYHNAACEFGCGASPPNNNLPGCWALSMRPYGNLPRPKNPSGRGHFLNDG